jgi:hypothetical protein
LRSFVGGAHRHLEQAAYAQGRPADGDRDLGIIQSELPSRRDSLLNPKTFRITSAFSVCAQVVVLATSRRPEQAKHSVVSALAQQLNAYGLPKIGNMERSTTLLIIGLALVQSWVFDASLPCDDVLGAYGALPSTTGFLSSNVLDMAIATSDVRVEPHPCPQTGIPSKVSRFQIWAGVTAT